MPAVAARGSRRRTIAEINMVPFIDVMLVLLIIFMVTAPLITTGVIDLPTVGKAKKAPEHVIEVQVVSDESLKLRVDGKDEQPIVLKNLATRVRQIQGGNVISADKAVKYEAVVKVMDTLQRAGVQRVGLSVKSSGG
ncbi:biopolymer transporter ExbD [Piscinibacter sp.]|uniref:biopolymer transporter ExbD n=1 Tax=Piscinibacter sp. TaxID=1903157 RepID=UPI003784EB7D